MSEQVRSEPTSGAREATSPEHAPKRINLALQGGGAHGAFTWGLLDHPLEDGWVEIEAISGTSAGSMNAAVVGDGLVAAGASQMGADVVLIESDQMGGECLKYGCSSSKALLAAANMGQCIRGASAFGVDRHEPAIDFARFHDRIHELIARIAWRPRRQSDPRPSTVHRARGGPGERCDDRSAPPAVATRRSCSAGERRPWCVSWQGSADSGNR